MIVCGLKLTHDGGAAVMEDGKLLFSCEIEKLANNPRYSPFPDLDDADDIFSSFGCRIDDLDFIAVDGWQQPSGLARVDVTEGGRHATLPVAPYVEDGAVSGFDTHDFEGLRLSGREVRYRSYPHSTGHVMSAYASSPFAQHEAPSLVLVWDGGMLPRLYLVEPRARRVHSFGPIGGLLGSIYNVFALHFAPFAAEEAPPPTDDLQSLDLSVAGKLMAYCAVGQVQPEIVELMRCLYHETLDVSTQFAFRFSRDVRSRTVDRGASEVDVLASFQAFLGDQLLDWLTSALERTASSCRNLCFAGGSALNIKWNARIRDSGLVAELWVPPFPNDSGSAVGTACAELAARTGSFCMDWDVYSGPGLHPFRAQQGWRSSGCSVGQLARLLHESQEPVVVLQGRAELGPRALGNRSILAAATSPGIKDELNRIKARAWYRPVSAVCLQHEAGRVFDPGSREPFMLHDHLVRPEWRMRIPGVLHLDGSCRLQTVTAAQNPMLARLLHEYAVLSDVPVLCNTSANRSGCGFFPDAASAMAWGGTPYVWANGVLYWRDGTQRPSVLDANNA
jgi:carbamoyltransferase